jgi:antitoxin component YwqK of YwqJK toxin-antitoxin module
MQSVILILCFLTVFVPTAVLGQSNQKETPPAWLPKETVKPDTAGGKKGRSNDLKSFISGLDPVVGASLPGGNGKSGTLSSLFGETIPDLGLRVKDYKDQKEERKLKKEKRRLSKTEYDGIQMESMSIKFGSGDRATVENFHVLKEAKNLNPYVRAAETRYYDKKTKRLSSSLIKEKQNALLLHGSYRKYSGENLIEEGFYYMGTKDGRWVKYDTKFNLIDKSLWNRGFPAESRISYYDSAYTQVKEVIPVTFGKVEGEFLQYYKEGQLMANGKYENGKKVGRWIEYYQFRRQRKKEIQYPKNSWDEDFEPFVLREWDDKGKLLYDYTKDPRASVEEETEVENP